MYHFLVVEHDHAEEFDFVARKVQVREDQARMLPPFEAVSLGLMPALTTPIESRQNPHTLRMIYRSAGTRRVLAGTGSSACDDHEPFGPFHVANCHHPTDTYRLTWYEAPEGQTVGAALTEQHFNHGKRTKTFAHFVTLKGKMITLPKNVSLEQEKSCRAAFKTTWWQP